MQECKCKDCPVSSRNKYLKDAPLAMGYIPWQTFDETFPLKKALSVGTVFPELCKPFCGRRCG